MSQVDHPKHYNNNPSGIECIEIIRHENFNCGNAIKYIWRRKDKNTEIQDLEKAVWYLNDEIKRLKNEESKNTVPGDSLGILKEKDNPNCCGCGQCRSIGSGSESNSQS